MRQRSVVALFLLVFAGVTAAQQQPAEVAKGFSADKTYDFSGLDAVNLFNGSVTLTLPLGQSYSVGPALSYRFTLVYTGNNWQMESNTWLDTSEDGATSVERKLNYYEPFGSARPPGSADVGLGWQLTMGRQTTGLTYASSEPGRSSEYALNDLGDSPPPPDANPNVWYTSDSSYQRLRYGIVCVAENPADTSCREVDFADGITQKYDSLGRLIEIRDLHPTTPGAFAHRVEIKREYDADGYVKAINVTDTFGRSHSFTLARMMTGRPAVTVPTDQPGHFIEPASYAVLTEASLAAFGGTTAVYKFSYVDQDPATAALDAAIISRRYAGTPDCEIPPTARTPVLTGVTLPDGLTYAVTSDRGDQTSFSLPELNPNIPTDCPAHASFSGNVTQLKLPTGGALEWQHRLWRFPSRERQLRCPTATGVSGPCPQIASFSEGVATRYTRDDAGDVVSKRTYSSDLYFSGGMATTYHTQITTVKDYENFTAAGANGNVVSSSLHYYSVANSKSESYNVGKAAEFGLPFTRYADDPDPVVLNRVANPDANLPNEGTTRFLSSKTLDGSGKLKRYTYVGYDADDEYRDEASNRRVAAESVVNVDDATWVVTTRSDYDGLGHYRTTTTKASSNMPSTPTRVSYTDYVGIEGIGGAVGVPYDPASPPTSWILSPIRSTSVTEGGRVVKAELCFNRHLVTRKRLIRDTVAGTAGANDVIVTYGYDGSGNVVNESYRGGDRPISTEAGVGTGPLCSLTSLGTLDYQIVHKPVSPASSDWTATSEYPGTGFLFSDVTVDKNTGLVSIGRDTAGVATTFKYDSSGRLVESQPAGRASTFYSYPTATNRVLTVEQHAGSTQTATPLTKSTYHFDALGRVAKETRLMPANTTAARTITYDQLGRRKTVSEFVADGTANPPVTTFVYDYAGRPTSTTAPDGSVVSHTYTGASKQTRTMKIWTGADSDPNTAGTQDSKVTVTETYDGYGRLAAVEEASGPTSAASPLGSAVKTEYTYGPDDKLSKVRMNTEASLGTLQQRFFEYDGRGFLQQESQPESGTTAYLYDARGHVLESWQPAAQSQFDLKYTYDSAERLLKIEGRNIDAEATDPPFRLVKTFEYGTSATDKNRGKLLKAARYNYVGGSLPDIYKVEDLYSYGDDAGRMTARTTAIIGISSGNVVPLREFIVGATYDALGAVQNMTYPVCKGCSFSPTAPVRNEARTYDAGRLSTLSGFTAVGEQITYWPNGMRHVLPHSNGIADTQTITNMARPSSIKFATYDRCVQPKIVAQPGNQASPYSGAAVTLSVTVSGTTPVTYDWYTADQNMTPVGTAATITVSPTETTSYNVDVWNECGSVLSETATVTVDQPCEPPTTGQITPVSQPDGVSWVLTPAPTAMKVRAYQWRRLPDEVTIVGQEETLAIGPVSQDTTYKFTVSDECGSASATVTMTAPPKMPAAGLVATVSSDLTQIAVSWPAVTGASTYYLERRSGSAWTSLASVTGTSYSDTSVLAGRTYAYRVRLGTSYSDADVATTLRFAPAVAGQPVDNAPADSMLLAVNEVREAAGWPALSWSTILGAGEPLVAEGQPVTASQVHACRARMNEARQALGALGLPFSNSGVSGVGVKAVHFNEVQQGAQ